MHIPHDVARKIGYYVYLYVNPRTGKPIYVGKGKGSRMLAHMSASGRSKKVRVLRELRKSGLKPRIEILAHGINDEETAFRIESAVIDALGLEQLTNQMRGWRSVEFGRMPLRQLLTYYRAKPVTISDPVILIRINKLYHPRMSATEMYEATRGVWKLNPERASKARYVLAVFDGIVQEVYCVSRWQQAGKAHYKTRIHTNTKVPGRWEFIGSKAPELVRRKYIDRSVRRYLPKGLQNPIVYRNC